MSTPRPLRALWTASLRLLSVLGAVSARWAGSVGMVLLAPACIWQLMRHTKTPTTAQTLV